MRVNVFPTILELSFGALCDRCDGCYQWVRLWPLMLLSETVTDAADDDDADDTDAVALVV